MKIYIRGKLFSQSTSSNGKFLLLNHFIYLTYKIQRFDFYRVSFIEDDPLCAQIKQY